MMLRAFAILFVLAPLALPAAEKTAKDERQLRAALADLHPGDVLWIESGKYRGGNYVKELAGTAEQPIVIAGRDPQNPPVFSGGNEAWHFSGCQYVTLRNIKAQGFPRNGINMDDQPKGSKGMVLEDVTILDTGPKGNFDALKLSGLERFTIRRCRFEGWGGSGIDMVGCHHGRIEQCVFRGKQGFSQSNGVQMKGGSSDLHVERCFFDHTGERGVNIGGSTGPQFFRPQGAGYESTRITVVGNRFVSTLAPICFVSAAGGHVHHNTIYLPEKWVLRILQEGRGPNIKPCRDGVFEQNLIVYDRRVNVFVNVGDMTEPDSFTFRNNAWHCVDGKTRVRLPKPEQEGVYGIDPRLHDAGKATMCRTSQDDQLKDKGADAYPGQPGSPK